MTTTPSFVQSDSLSRTPGTGQGFAPPRWSRAPLTEPGRPQQDQLTIGRRKALTGLTNNSGPIRLSFLLVHTKGADHVESSRCFTGGVREMRISVQLQPFVAPQHSGARSRVPFPIGRFRRAYSYSSGSMLPPFLPIHSPR